MTHETTAPYFDKASERRDHHLITMSAKLYSEGDAMEAYMRIVELRYAGMVSDDHYRLVADWIDAEMAGRAQWREQHPGRRKPVDETIGRHKLTAEQRKRLRQQHRVELKRPAKPEERMDLRETSTHERQ